jgi:hypothetical protein
MKVSKLLAFFAQSIKISFGTVGTDEIHLNRYLS